MISYSLKIRDSLSSIRIDPTDRRQRTVTYALILVTAGLFGFYFAWAFRGLPVHFGNLFLLTPAIVIPSLIVIFLLLRAVIKMRTDTTMFMIGVITCINIAVLIQWPFYSMGYHLFGKIDLNNSIQICEMNRERILQDTGNIRLRNITLRDTLPNGKKLSVGNNPFPETFVTQDRRTYTNKRGEYYEELDYFVFCRLLDRRTGNIYTYSYDDMKWSVRK